MCRFQALGTCIQSRWTASSIAGVLCAFDTLIGALGFVGDWLINTRCQVFVEKFLSCQVRSYDTLFPIYAEDNIELWGLEGTGCDVADV